MKIVQAVMVLVLAMLAAVSAKAQKAPDDEAILKEITDGASPHYYHKLMGRYMAGDTTLAVDDYRYLYYGYVWQENFKPQDGIEAEREMARFVTNNRSVLHEKTAELIALGKKVMEYDPFSPRNINLMTYAYNLSGDTINERISADRLSKVIAAIESSGTGEKEGSPWHILRLQHVNDLMSMRSLEILRRVAHTNRVEFVEVKQNPQGVKGYYFDYGRAYSKKPENMPERKKGLEVNKNRPTILY